MIKSCVNNIILCIYTYLIVDVNQMIQNYTFTFTLTGEPSGLEFNLLIDSNIPVMSSCSSKIDCVS